MLWKFSSIILGFDTNNYCCILDVVSNKAKNQITVCSQKNDLENEVSEIVSETNNTLQYFESKNNDKAWTKTHTVEKGLNYDTKSSGYDYDTEPNSNTDYSGYETETNIQYETENEEDDTNRNKKDIILKRTSLKLKPMVKI